MTHAAPIWLYDGVCALCSGAIQYVLRHERDHAMRFVSIQSAEGRALAVKHGINPDDPDTFLFVENGVAHQKSDGVIALFRHVSGPARLMMLGRFVPKPLRDVMYDAMARHRYRIFGRRTACLIPDQALRGRFALPEAS
jgi:predicted DCC family thiol-disulfide oxidoreductase YuxK